MKSGPPSKEVRIPTGNTIGESIVRASVSAANITIEPIKGEATIKNL